MKPLKSWKNLDTTTRKTVLTTSLLMALALAIIIGAIIFAFVFSSKLPHQYTVRGESMAPTLSSGQVIELSHADGDAISAGDVVVFEPPVEWKASVTQKEVVKRVVAVGGDQVDLIRGIEYGGLWVNNERVTELPLDYECENKGASFILEEGTVLVLGDNVSNSSDSLTRLCGNAPVYAVPVENVLDYGEIKVVK